MGRRGSATATARRCGALQRGRDWIWITGNHDPHPADGIGGSFGGDARASARWCFGTSRTGAAGEIAGHLHPVARVNGRGRTVSRRCFASDGARLVMPAFGAYAGGLNVRDRAFADVFGSLAFTAHMLGEGRLYAIAGARCCLIDRSICSRLAFVRGRSTMVGARINPAGTPPRPASR